MVTVFLEASSIEFGMFELNVLLKRAFRTVVSPTSLHVTVVLALDFLGSSPHSLLSVRVQLSRLLFLFFLSFFLN
jgi:hypothetical protein